ncbi:MAG TPA: glycoside hydrolase N-terminal domain-containing protein [Leifsonia sp.]|nr:glycoside hydrolase N-terminal domain-containing protein [Leifsonia sp.]
MPDTQPGRLRSISLERCAEDAVDGFLLGNGALGATVYGRPGTERFDLNLDTVWSGGPADHGGSEQRSATLHSLQTAVAQSRHVEADYLARTLQSGTWTQSYQPLGGLLWRWTEPETVQQYQRQLDLELAQTSTTAGDAHLTAFVSHPDQVLVAYTSSPDSSGSLEFDSPHPEVRISHEQHDGAQWLIATGRAPTTALPDYLESLEPFTYGFDDVSADGTVDRGMGWAVVAAVDTDTSGRRRLLAAAASGFRGSRERPSADLHAIASRARLLVRAARQRSVQELADRHRADYRSLFNRGRIEVGGDVGKAGEVAQTYFDLGRYLLIASSRRGTQPINLQGIWNTQRRAAWSCNYTTNINVQMNYWAVEPIGLGELHEPLHSLIEDLSESGRRTARDTYFARGAATHHNTDLWRFNQAVSGDPQWANWQFGLAWLAQHLLNRLEFNWCDEFAATTAFPVLTEVAAFALDQLTEAHDGTLIVSPSTSPEHRFFDGEQIGAVTAGSTLDQELAFASLTGYLDLARRLHHDDDPLTQECSHALERLRLPGVSPEGILPEWANPSLQASELGHRHLSHLYGCYPGTRITETRTPREFEAVRKSLAARLSHGSGYTGWSQAWVLCLAARLRDSELAEQAIQTLTGELSSDSLLDLHPHPAFPSGRVFQIDGNLGAIAGMVELLVQSHDDAISLLPALPSIWPSGRALDLPTRDGHTVRQIEWQHGLLTSALIESGTNGTIVIEIADGTSLQVQAGDRLVDFGDVPTRPRGRRRIAWSATAGMQYELNATSSSPT